MPKRPIFRFPKPWPFLADQTARDASLWRFLLCLPGGAVAALLASVAMALLIAAVCACLVIGRVIPASAFEHIAQVMQQSAIPADDLAATVSLLALLALLNSAAFVGFVAFGAGVYRRTLHSYWTAARRYRWRLLAVSLGLFVVILGPLLYLTRDIGDGPAIGPIPLLVASPYLAGRVFFALAGTLTLLAAAAAEEILFRGFVLRHLSAMLRAPWAAVLLGSLIFSAAHLDFSPDAFLERAAMGIGLSYAVLRLGGTEFSLGIHAGNNIIIVLFIEPLQLTPSPHQPWDWAILPVLAGLILAYVGLVELVARWAPLARWAGVEKPPPPSYFALNPL